MGNDKAVPYAADDPTVEGLARFLENTPLSNGARAPIPPGISGLLAQAICNYTQGVVWDTDNHRWTDLTEWSRNPEIGDVDVKLIGNPPDQVVRMTHRITNISVLAEDHETAWRLLKQKVVSDA